MDPDLAVLTLNCQLGYRLEQLKAFLHEQLSGKHHDFVLLQEVDGRVRDALRAMKLHTHGYELLQAHNKTLEETASTCIIFRTSYELCGTRHFSFQEHVRYRSHNGGIIGVFSRPAHARMPTQRLVVCSVHLHDRERFLARRREIAQIKRTFAELDPQGTMMKVIGGDFNNMFFRELQSVKGRMGPEFVHCTAYPQHSHDTAHLEPDPWLERLVVHAGRAGLRLRTRIDHIFLDATSAQRFDSASEVFDVLVSDHRPVRLLLFRKP